MNKILLKDRVDFLYGFSIRVDNEAIGKYPVYGSNGVTGFIDSFKVKGPGVIVGRKGTVGAVNFSNRDFTPTDTAYYLSLKDKNKDDIKFWYYYLQLLGLNKLNTHSSVPGLSREIAYFINVNPPDFTKQKKIASVLSLLDSKMDLNISINSELESMAKTLYDYWFVQFDFPNEQGKPYKSSGGKMVWDEKLKREIPEGWESKKMVDWITADKSGDWGKEEPQGSFIKKVTCIRGADIKGLNGLEECNPPTRYILEKNEYKILTPYDLIIEISGGSPTQSTGRMAYITEATLKRFKNPMICSNFCKAISIKDKNMLYNFVYYWNSLYESGAFFGYEGKTSGIKNFLFDSFVNSYYTVVPKDSVVEKFYNLMQEIQAKKQTVLEENQVLSELRDWLLPMLMNGQVKVK